MWVDGWMDGWVDRQMEKHPGEGDCDLKLGLAHLVSAPSLTALSPVLSADV